MRNSLAFPIRFWSVLLVCLLTYQFSTEALANGCKFEKDIDLVLDLSDSEVLAISAAAGNLEVTGVAGTSEAVIHGRVCASQEKWLDQSSISTSSANRAQIDVNLPKTSGSWSLFGMNNYAALDLRIEVPQNLAIDIRDSSGDIYLRDIGAVQIADSSGDIEVKNGHGPVSIRDSSGDIEIEQLQGDLTITADSSGDIRIEDITGMVLVEQDSSGDIRVARVTSHVVIENDSSGDINVTDVGGDFKVLSDGSGSIRSNDIAGNVQLPKDR
jgi:DUF4097 and DUF4098 domain-containing protein YvlB